MTTLAERLKKARDLNPWGVQKGEKSHSVLVDANTEAGGRRWDWIGRVAVPLKDYSGNELNLEQVATVAFQAAQDEGLEAPLMALCSFYYWDDEDGDWVHFL